MMTGTALVPVSTHPHQPEQPAYANVAARIYAFTQDRRTAPVCTPRKGRIVDLAG